MALFWCVYEYLKTKGFAGFSYGVMGYTLWNCPVLNSIASLTGVWGCSFLIAMTNSAILYAAESIISKKWTASEYSVCTVTLVLWTFSLVWGLYSTNAKDDWPYTTVCVAAIQNNDDPWTTDVNNYRKSVEDLCRLSDEAITEKTDVQFVIWPETAVVPPVVKNWKTRNDRTRYEMISGLLEYINEKNSTFIIGNENSVKGKGYYTDDYNSALVFDSRLNNVIPPQPMIYNKVHLVPFTESFPYEKQFPWLYKKLLLGDTHFWSAGSEFTVFDVNNVKFSTPICFEDTFGDLCRKYVLNGAEVFFNLTNDSWSHSEACQVQHLSMAVFRSIENNVPTVRSTASGITCFIDNKGRIYNRTKSFEKSYLTDDVKVYGNSKRTLYTRAGDFLPAAEVIVFVIILCFGVLKKILNKVK